MILQRAKTAMNFFLAIKRLILYLANASLIFTNKCVIIEVDLAVVVIFYFTQSQFDDCPSLG